MSADAPQSKPSVFQGEFDSSREFSSCDPVDRTAMTLTLDQIREYDHNPRNARNAKHDEIKEAIRAKKRLDSQLTITRRPEDRGKPYMCYAGGNTRLRILKELYQETGDPAFYTVECVYVPWLSESNTIAAHLGENDIRGDLVFIDRALAVRDFRLQYEKEQGTSVSIRELANALKREGYPLNAPLLSRMAYTVDVLWPVIPNTLSAGLGIEQVRKLRQLEDAMSNLLKHYQMDENRARPLFLECLAERDGADWNYDAIKRCVAGRLAEVCDSQPPTLQLDLEALLMGYQPGPNAPESAPLVEPHQNKQSTKTKAQVVELDAIHRPSAQKSPDPQRNDCDHPPTPRVTPAAFTATEAPSKVIHEATDPQPPVTDTALRTRMWVIATRLAQRNDMGECVLHVNHGCGFVMDLPDVPLYEHSDTPSVTESRKLDLWWLLSSFTGQWVSEPNDRRAFLDACPKDSRLHPILQTLTADDTAHYQHAHNAITAHVLEPRSILDAPSLLLTLDEEDYRTLLNMINSQRQLQAMTGQEEKRDR